MSTGIGGRREKASCAISHPKPLPTIRNFFIAVYPEPLSSTQDSSNLYGCFERNFQQRTQGKVQLAEVDLWVLETAVNDVCCPRQPRAVTFRFGSRN
jgi:hypothetical protein